MINTLPTIGCDPELLVTSRTTGNIVPICGLLGGSKKNPRPIKTKADIGLGVLEDGVMLEFNMNPCKSSKEFETNVHTACRAIENELVTLDLQPYYQTCEYEFPLEQLKKHPEAMIFGCDPDFMAFQRGQEREPPTPEQLGNFRCAGQHIHIGYPKDKVKMPDWAFVQYLEAFIGCYYLPAQASKGMRRKFYGIPGLYRPKDYGFEWRTPDNWLSNLRQGITGKGSYISNVYTIVCGLLADERRAREMYDLLDWNKVFKLAGTNGRRDSDGHINLQEDLHEYREEIMERGRDFIDENTEQKVDVARVAHEGMINRRVVNG